MSKSPAPIIALFLLAACTAAGSDAADDVPTTVTASITSSTAVSEPPTSKLDEPNPENQPTEFATAGGWISVAQLPDGFHIRSAATTETMVYLVGGTKPTEQFQQSPATDLLAIDRATSTVRPIEWPDGTQGDVTNLDDHVLLTTGDGLFQLDALAGGWVKVADGTWSPSWTTDYEVVTGEGRTWSPEGGVSTIPPFPIASVADVTGNIDALYVTSLRSGFWVYDRQGGEWEALPPASLYATATAMVASDGSIIAADYEMDAGSPSQPCLFGSPNASRTRSTFRQPVGSGFAQASP